MKISTRIIPYFLWALWLCISLIACNQPEEPQRKYRIIHNNDGSDALYNKWFHNRPLTKADIHAYVDMVADKNITTYMMCTGSDFLYIQSRYGRRFGDDRNGELDCGDDTATYRVWKRFHQNILNLEAEGTDLIEASLLRAQEHGLEAFITYRMNDLHFADTQIPCPIHASDFWLEHPEYWLGDSTQGWHSDGALDFTYPEVRQRKLDMITEQLERYDFIDGYDLDFMRFPVYFKTGEGPEKVPLITDLVQKIRRVVDSLSDVRGKRVLLSVRVPFTMDGCMMKGLDVREWVKQDLVDFISIGAHWKGETALPIAKFREDLGNDKIPIYGSIDDGGYTPRESFSHGMFRGMASHILSQGGDGLYLFNYYFGLYNTELDGNILLEPGEQTCRIMEPSVLAELGSLETLRNRNKIYCESDGVTDSYGILQIGTLPVAVSDSRISKANIFVGDDVARDVPEESIIFIRTDRPAKFDLEVNGIAVTDIRPEYPELYNRTEGMIGRDEVYAFVLPKGTLKQGNNELVFLAKYPIAFMVRRAEAALKYGDVATHGYF